MRTSKRVEFKKIENKVNRLYNVNIEANKIVTSICTNVLNKIMSDQNIESFHVVGLYLTDPKDIITVSIAALSS